MSRILTLAVVLPGLAACSAPAGEGPFDHPIGLSVRGPDGALDRDVEEGRGLLENGDYDAALALLLKARKRHPDSRALNYLLAEVHQANGQCLKASLHLARAGAGGELGEWTQVLAGRWIRGLADGTLRCTPRRKAAAAAAHLLSLSPAMDDPELRSRLSALLLDRARELEGSGRCSNALDLMERSAALDGHGLDGVLLRGRCLLRRGRHDEVLNLAHGCLETTPPAEDAVASLARRAEETFRHETAISLWSLLSDRPGFSDEAAASQGRLQLKVGRRDEAVASWRHYIANATDPAERLARAVDAAQQLGEFQRFEDAVALLDTPLAEHPDDLPAVRLRAGLLWRDRRRADAVASLQGWVERAGDRVFALETALEILTEWEGWNEGLKLLYRIRTDGRGGHAAEIAATAHLYTGLFRTRLGDLDEAGKAFQEYLDAEGHAGRARARIGAALFAAGDPSRALPWLEAAVRKQPRWPAAAIDLASVYHVLDHGERIPSVFEAYVAADTDKGAAWAAAAQWWSGVGRLKEALAASTRAMTLLEDPPPSLLLLQGRLLLTSADAPEGAWPLLERAAAEIDAGDLVEIWRLVDQRPGRQASCVRTAVMQRGEACIGAASDGRRALLLPATRGEGTFPLTLEAELDDLLGCGRGDVDARIDRYLRIPDSSVRTSSDAAVSTATTLVRAFLDASYPDRVAALLEQFPELPLQPADIELRLIEVLLPRAPRSAKARLTRLAASPGLLPEHRLLGAEAFLAAGMPEAAEVILGDDRGDFDDEALCRCLRLQVETSLALGAEAEALELGRTMSEECTGRPCEIISALDLLTNRGPGEDAFDLAVHLLDLLQEPSDVRRIVVAAVRAGGRAGLELDEVGDRLARASKGWKGEVEVAAVLAATGRFAAARRLLEAALRRNPREGAALKRVLLLHRMATLTDGNEALPRERVIELCERFLLANERSDESLLSLLGFLEGLGFTGLATDLADRHIPADTSNSGLLLLRASLALVAGDADHAPTLLNRGMMAAPDIKSFLEAATGMLERYGRHGDAVRLLETAVQIRPDLYDVAMELAWRRSIAPSPDWEEISGIIGRVVARTPAHLERGVRILLGGNRLDLARSLLLKVRDSADERAAWTASRLLLAHAAETGAHADVHEVVETFTSRKLPGFRLQSLADLLFEHGYLDEGLALLERHQGKNPAQAANVLRALKLIQAGRVDEGLALVEMFFEELVLGHRKLTRNDRMTPELHRLFDSVNDFLWDMGLGSHAAAQLDRAIETYPDDPALLERRCRSILSDADRDPTDALALLQRLLDVKSEPTGLKTRSLVHLLAARRVGRGAANIMLDAFDPAQPGWWTPMLLELLVVLDRPGLLRRTTEQLAARPAASPELLTACGAAMLSRGRIELAELLLRQALLRTRLRETAGSTGPKSTAFSRLGTSADPDAAGLTERLMVLLVKAMAAADASSDAVHAAARSALQIRADAKGGISAEARRVLSSTLEEAEVWDAALAELGLQQALGEGGAAPFLREFRIHLIRGDEAAARETFRRCAATNHGTTGLLTRFAEQARRILALELSVELYGLARRLDGANLPLAFAGSEPLLLLGREAEAEELLQLYAGDNGPHSLRNRRLEAAALAFRYNRFGLARVLAEGVDSAAAWLERSRNHLRADDVNQAWRLFEEAAKRAPVPAAAARALLATQIKAASPDPRLLENLLVRAQEPDESPSVNRYWEGVLLLERSRWDSAVQTFESGLRGTRARFGLGISMVKQLLSRGRVEEAEAFALRAFAGFKAAAVRTALAKAIAETLHADLVPEEHVPAVADLGVRAASAALAADPADTWVLTQLAEVQYAAGRVDEAVRTYDKAIDDLPGDSGLENNQAYLLALTGREPERGLALVRSAIRREPAHNIFYLDTLGWLQYGQGRLKEAEDNIRAALLRADFTVPGGLAEALYHLGVVQRDLGRLDDAKAAFHKASVNDPYGLYGGRARKALESLGVDPYHR